MSALLPSSHTNYRFLTSPEKRSRLKNIRKVNRALDMKLKRLKAKLSEVIETSGVHLDADTSHDLETIMEEEETRITYSEESFQSIFWKQQKEVLIRKGNSKKGIRWHPLMIKWCLYLRHQSRKAYETLQQSGCISLPSQRTLRDYSHSVRAGSGFTYEVDQQLLQAANLENSPDFHKLVCLLIDEMHIKEDLVYNKYTGKLIGFVDLGEINNHLTKFEQTLNENDDTPVLAKSMVVMMVKGLFTNLQFPYVQYPCTSLVGEQLFCPFWNAISHLERMGFKVCYFVIKCISTYTVGASYYV